MDSLNVFLDVLQRYQFITFRTLSKELLLLLLRMLRLLLLVMLLLQVMMITCCPCPVA